MPYSLLILGGTLDARLLARGLAARGFSVELSLAGRTTQPVDQGVPVRSGGFGGAAGLAAYLRERRVDMLIDATHPYAARISLNAAMAADAARIPLVALRRPGWERLPGDRWKEVDGAEDAIKALCAAPRRAFLALGRQELGPFEAAPQHSYLVRSVDPVWPPLEVPDIRYVLARGPFDEKHEFEMLRDERIDAVVAKNSGGPATYGKIAAARHLGIDVILLRRPQLPDVRSGRNVDETEALVVGLLSP